MGGKTTWTMIWVYGTQQRWEGEMFQTKFYERENVFAVGFIM